MGTPRSDKLATLLMPARSSKTHRVAFSCASVLGVMRSQDHYLRFHRTQGSQNCRVTETIGQNGALDRQASFDIAATAAVQAYCGASRIKVVEKSQLRPQVNGTARIDTRVTFASPQSLQNLSAVLQSELSTSGGGSALTVRVEVTSKGGGMMRGMVESGVLKVLESTSSLWAHYVTEACRSTSSVSAPPTHRLNEQSPPKQDLPPQTAPVAVPEAAPVATPSQARQLALYQYHTQLHQAQQALLHAGRKAQRDPQSVERRQVDYLEQRIAELRAVVDGASNGEPVYSEGEGSQADVDVDATTTKNEVERKKQERCEMEKKLMKKMMVSPSWSVKNIGGGKNMGGGKGLWR